jgi:hypothetical protein
MAHDVSLSPAFFSIYSHFGECLQHHGAVERTLPHSAIGRRIGFIHSDQSIGPDDTLD